LQPTELSALDRIERVGEEEGEEPGEEPGEEDHGVESQLEAELRAQEGGPEGGQWRRCRSVGHVGDDTMLSPFCSGSSCSWGRQV
jgi:hypothetical protein